MSIFTTGPLKCGLKKFNILPKKVAVLNQQLIEEIKLLNPDIIINGTASILNDDIIDENDPKKVMLDAYGAIIDINDANSNEALIDHNSMLRHQNYGRNDKQLVRKLWNSNRTKSKKILDFLWHVTGKSYSARALHCVDQEIQRIEQVYNGSDKLWLGSLQNKNEVRKELKEHRDSFIQKQYRKLKEQETELHRMESHSANIWKESLRGGMA